jgi:single-strand DNA-binding protein
MMNAVALVGNLATDVELREVDGERKVASFLLAVDRNGPEGGADFIRVSTWNRQAEVCDEYLTRGRLVSVEGRLRSRSWEEAEGKRRTALDVVALRVHFLPGREGGSSEGAEAPFQVPVTT